MLSAIAFLVGAVIGGLVAKRRGGKPADIAQYAAVYGLILALVTVVISVLVLRLSVL